MSMAQVQGTTSAQTNSSQVAGSTNASRSNTGSTAAGSAADRASMSGASKSDFMKLLVAQLRNQDPLKPMEDKEFIAQMAQLNTLEQVTELNDRMALCMNLEAMGQAASLIGKHVEAETAAGSIKGVVQEVQLDTEGLVLIVSGQSVALADIRRITPGGQD